MSNYYVTARHTHWRAYLCGPFRTMRAAQMMERAVREAIKRDPDASERMRQATILSERTDWSKPGSLDYRLLRVEDIL